VPGGVRRSSVVVGRQAELDRLRTAVRAAASGAGDAVVLVGEGGIGKTRLLNEAAQEARRRGVPVLVGRASVAVPVSFGMIAESLRSWLRGKGTPAPSVYDAGLRLMLPEWPAPAASSGLNDSQLRLLALEGLVDVVRGIAAPRGVVVVLDDLHYADAESLEAFRYLASASLDGVVVIAAARQHESTPSDRVLDALGQQGLVELWPVGPLDRGDIGDLAAAILGTRVPDEFVDAVLPRADGIPLLVEEIIEAHLRTGSLTVADRGALWRVGAEVVPRSVASLVASRLDRLPDAERDVITAAAVVGADDAGLLATVASQPSATVRAAIAAAVDAGLIESVRGRVEFRHAVIADAVRDQAFQDAVRAMHGRAAAALEKVAEDDHSVLERIANHLEAIGERDRAASALIAAAASASATHALLRAEALADRARSLPTGPVIVDAADDAVAGALADQGRWADALERDEKTVARRGQTRERWLRMVRCALDGRHFDLARSLASVGHERWGALPYADVAVGRVALLDGDGERALEHARNAAQAADADAVTRCGALDLMGRALDFIGRRDEAADAWAKQAAVAENAGLVAERLRALMSLAELELFTAQPPVRMREAVQVAHDAGAIVEEVWAQFNLTIALSNLGDMADAARVAQHTVQLCRDHRLDLLPFVLLSDAATRGFMGDPTAWDDLVEARRLGGDAGDIVLHASSIAGEWCIVLGRYDDARTYLEEVNAAVAASPGSLPVAAAYWMPLVLQASGRTEEAAAALATAAALPNAERWYSRPIILAVAEAALDGDEAGVDAALASAPRMPFEAAVLRVLAAEIIRGPAQARWLREALDLYESHNVLLGVDRVRGLLREAGGVVPRRRKSSIPQELIAYGVTGREAETLALVAEGLSNAAIAEKLFVSVRTVESHVSSLLSKLGATSRAELTQKSG